LKLIKRGAEAEIHLSERNGRQVAVKTRVPKSYRHEEIDKRLREARTKLEAKLISEARSFGIPTPIIYDVDIPKNQITMDFIDGVRIKERLHEVNEKEQRELCLEIGRSLGRLHRNHIIHGDLTTSNMILMDGKVFFIDFSLGGKSKEIEDKGVDLHLLSEAFESTHSEILGLFEHVITGYKDEYEEAGAVLKKVKEIEKRGRYT
jgi:TP53 regulating kinase-like protein